MFLAHLSVDINSYTQVIKWRQIKATPCDVNILKFPNSK